MATRQYKDFEQTQVIDPANLNLAFGNKKIHIVIDVVEMQNHHGEWEASAKTICQSYASATGRITFDDWGEAERMAKQWQTHPETRCEKCMTMLAARRC